MKMMRMASYECGVIQFMHGLCWFVLVWGRAQYPGMKSKMTVRDGDWSMDCMLWRSNHVQHGIWRQSTMQWPGVCGYTRRGFVVCDYAAQKKLESLQVYVWVTLKQSMTQLSEDVHLTTTILILRFSTSLFQMIPSKYKQLHVQSNWPVE